tara:strand:+ start:55 stop:201 length:147 start_codon:yes stop_codon:yes gene_type:complete
MDISQVIANNRKKMAALKAEAKVEAKVEAKKEKPVKSAKSKKATKKED